MLWSVENGDEVDGWFEKKVESWEIARTKGHGVWLSARTCDLSFYLFGRPMPGKKEVKTWKKEAGMERCKPQRNTATACPCTFRARTLASLSLSEKRIQTCHARSTSALVLFRVVRWSRGILVSDVALLGVENCHKQSLMETQMI